MFILHISRPKLMKNLNLGGFKYATEIFFLYTSSIYPELDENKKKYIMQILN